MEVSEAYEILSDQKTRQIYDRYGHDGLKSHQSGRGHHDPFDLFSRFFGGANSRGQRREAQGPNQEFKIEISLRDFYNGADTTFEWNKQHICSTCDGSGSADGVVDTCRSCGGHGVRIVKQQLAPGMFQQMQRPCDACSGRGKTIRKKCPSCSGARVERKSTPVDLKIERGIPKGHAVVYENEGDDSPDYVSGNLVIHLAELDPSTDENPQGVDGVFFRRKGNDLYWTEVLSLREAWMGGWSRNLTHLDAHVVRLSRPRGSVIQPGQIDTIHGEGMPKWHEDGDSVYHKHDFGNLYVKYEVVLPDMMEKDMEADFWDVWEKWRIAKGVDLEVDSGRPVVEEAAHVKDEL